jgi:monofunctional biosynthetic peptidoglycan transglycosylase
MSTAAGRARASSKKKARSRFSAQHWPVWLRRVRTVAIVLVAIPLILIPVYAIVPPPFSTPMIWARFSGPVERDWVSIEEMSPVLVASVLMSEDGRFCSHWGVDWVEVGRALDDDDGRPRGASTISMQVVRNLFLWTSRSYIRKVIEVPLAFYADLVWSKRRMMEIYLNTVQWGPQVFGAEAAARAYFRRSAKEVSSRQAALMAVTLPNPYLRNPAKPSAAMQRRAGVVQSRAAQSGDYIGCLRLGSG